MRESICIIGPSRSGKSLLAHSLAVKLKIPVLDTGQMVRLTADEADAARLAAGGLSERGNKGTSWVNDMVNKAIKDEPHILVGYPRSDAQFENIRDKAVVVCLLAPRRTLLNRSRGGRADNTVIVLDKKNTDFFSFLCGRWKNIDVFVTNDGEDIDKIADQACQRLHSIINANTCKS